MASPWSHVFGNLLHDRWGFLIPPQALLFSSSLMVRAVSIRENCLVGSQGSSSLPSSSFSHWAPA